MSPDLLAEFSSLVAPDRPDDSIDLVDAALLIARIAYPSLEAAPYQAQIRSLADHVRDDLPAVPDAADFISALNIVLFVEEEFRGNEEDYYDPRNSFLNDVLERKLGIPITLSLLYMEVARHVGFALFGVGLPGHFLVKHFTPEGDEVLIDPYEAGAIVTEEDCEQRVLDIYDGQMAFQREFLAPISRRQLLARLLNNLRGIYFNARNFKKAIEVLDLALAIHPHSADDVKQRAIVRYNVGMVRGAFEDFEEYLRLIPEAEDADEIRDTLVSLRNDLARMN